MEAINYLMDKGTPEAISIGVPQSERPGQPVIKISFEGFLLFANTAGVEFLDVLSDYTKAPALTHLLNKYPDILHPESSMDICIQLYETCFYFSVVAFKEDGYTGIYGYHSVRNCYGDSKVA
jgi:hypothetical protein